ncbi:MAG TPA: SRPBCC domain-containing protein [Candidatus Limnocylindria bacterium]|nr:SRPBCC domain-containing protein [Candidatus Limnocylindria bacterium]
MKTSPDTTVQITRVIDAPRQRVFAAWTDPRSRNQWWGPAGIETHELIFEARVGGNFRWVLSTPEGERMATRGEFHDVRRGEKLTFTWEPEGTTVEHFESLVTVEFREIDAATTELRLTHENLPSEESRDEHTDGWNSALDKFEKFARELTEK